MPTLVYLHLLEFGLVVTKEVLNFGLKDLDIDLEMPGT
jgi:hypothetical protein